MRPVRFIHTADIHLDTSFSGSGFPSRIGVRKREAIRGTFRRILEEARALPVDFVLIAGDLFESERVTPDTFEFVRRQLEGLGAIRVFISPGNHDPCSRGSLYREESWPSNVHIFDREEFVPVELAELGVRLAGFGYVHSQLDDRLFAKLPALDSRLRNIVIAHGSDLSRVPAGKSRHGPFEIGEIAGKNISYGALGHYHQQHRIPSPDDGAQVWYAGIPEGRAWDEEGACGYLLGEISDAGCRVESRKSGRYPLKTLLLDCESFSTREQIFEAIAAGRGPEFDADTILRVRLEGTLDTRVDLSLAELEERLAGYCLHIEWDDRTLPAIDFESLAAEKTMRGRFVRILSERIASSEGRERAILERARLYGVQALSGREVRVL